MAKPNVFPFFIVLGKAAPERVPKERVKLYEWLAYKLLGSAARMRKPRGSVYVTTEQLQNRRVRIGDLPDLAEPPAFRRRGSLVILDLATSPYHLLRSFLEEQVFELGTQWLRNSRRRTIAILLPSLRPDIARFWSRRLDKSGRLIVLTNDGTSWPATATSKIDPNEYKKQAVSGRDMREKLRERIVPKVGHFEILSPGEPSCSRLFYDTEAAEREIGDMLIVWGRANLAPRRSYTFVSHGQHSDSFHSAVGGAALELDHHWVRLSGDPPLVEPDRIAGTAVLVFNVVHSGTTFRDLVNELRRLNVPVAPHAVTVMTTGAWRAPGGELPFLDSLAGPPYDRNKIARHECHECRIKMPYTDPMGDYQGALRSIDAWRILLHHPWIPEPFGPGRSRLRLVPDMAAIFRTYGGWLAYKIGDRLRRLGIDDEVVFICPQEPHIELLLDKLGILLQYRQVAVQIPRHVLRVGRYDTGRSDEDENWLRQLRHLSAGRNNTIVLIDEFSFSHSTAQFILRLLRTEFGIEPRAYIPILDLSSQGVPFSRPPAYPLYRVPYPGDRVDDRTA